MTFAKVILFSLLGGLILNLMPCVLPVIGLKILSFAEQGGQSRRRSLLLNVFYSLGLLSVFMLLATASVMLNMAWGTQFQSSTFTFSMIVLVFVMALSFLGVWELPIPGFMGSGKSGELAAREGFAGAFFKGVFTTILATPCSGPFLGPVFGFTVSQPWWATYVIFFSIGLGMASPYLLIGMFPSLLGFLPKPGAWMDTFKNLVGFFLLGTVVYLFSILGQKYTIATLTLLVVIGFACWSIGRIPFTASRPKKLLAWIAYPVLCVAVGLFAFNYLLPFEKGTIILGENTIETKTTRHLTWHMYSQPELERAIATGKTVMVEFTAKWCPNCHKNMASAIDTPEVARIVEENDVVPIYADWTSKGDDIRNLLNSYGRDAIPVLAIYRDGDAENPEVLTDLISRNRLLAALKNQPQ